MQRVDGVRPGERFGITRWRDPGERGPDDQFNPPSVTGPEMLDAVLNERDTCPRAGAGWWTRPRCSIQRWTSPRWRRFAKMRRTVGHRETRLSECPPHVFASEKRGKTTGGMRLGEPGKAPTAAEVCCRLAADGWANPSRETVVARGSYAVHHWVHTWLDGDEATSNAWRRRTLGVAGGEGT